ncbi:Integrator complex subunit 5 [Aphelenchoides besseyi]|nr:Integrator complex subunit 5 [Aphelenchoides besseyi]
MRSTLDSAQRRRLIQLTSLADSLRVEAVYNRQATFIFTKQTNVDINSFYELFIRFPIARDAILEVLKAMCHESIYIHFLRADGRLKNTNTGLMEKEVSQFLTQFPSLLDELDSNEIRLRVLQWLFFVCAEIGKLNADRLKAGLARDRLPILLRVECIRALVSLIDLVLKSLFVDHTNEVVKILVDAFKYDVHFDWLLLYIVEKFPSKIIPHLIAICVNEMKLKTTAVLANKLITKTPKVMVITDLVLFLANRKVPDLRVCLIDHIEGYFTGRRSIHSILTIANMLLCVPSIAQALTTDIQPLINNQNLVKFLHLISHREWLAAVARPSNQDTSDVMANCRVMLTHLPTDAQIQLFELLIPYATNPIFLQEQFGLNDREAETMTSQLEIFMDVIFSVTFQIIIYGKKRQLHEFPHLFQIANYPSKLQQMFRQVLDGGKHGEYAAKLLVCCCLLDRKELAVQMIAELVYKAKSEELKNLCAFVRLLSTHFTHILTRGVSYLLTNLHEFESKAYDSDDLLSTDRLNYLRNIVHFRDWPLIEPQQSNGLVSYGLNSSTIDGYLQLSAVKTLIDVLLKLEYANESERLLNYVDYWIDLANNLRPLDIRMFDVNLLTDLVEDISAAGVLLIRRVTKFEDVTDERKLDFCKRYFNYCKTLMDRGFTEFTSEFFAEYAEGAAPVAVWYLTNFTTAFLENAFAVAHDLFGTPPRMFSSQDIGRYDDVDQFLLPRISRPLHADAKELSCLEMLRSKPFTQRKTATLAHSGVISNQHAKFKQKPMTKDEKFRCQIVAGMCVEMSETIQKFEETIPGCKQRLCWAAGAKLVKLLCPDALTSTMNWKEWPDEKDAVPSYVEVMNRIRALPLVYDLMLWIAQSGYVGICSILPVIKSMFAVIVNFHGATPMKFERLNEKHLEDIARVITIFLVSDFIPPRFKSIIRLFKVVDHFQAYRVLSAIWEYIRTISPQTPEGTRRILTGEINPTIHLQQGDVNILAPIIVPIIRENIDKLGSLLPLWFVEDDYEDAEIWVIADD